MVNCSALEVQKPKFDDRQIQFYNEVQSAGLESMNGANASVGMSVSVSERYCGWFSVRDRKHNVDSLNWILECNGNQCK